MRIGCLTVSNFPLAARLRVEPERARAPLVIVEGAGGAAAVIAANAAARAGVGPGLTLAQARAILPDLCARPRDAECERAAQAALLEAAEGFSPRVEDGGPGVAYLDLDGMQRRFPGPTGELDLSRALVRAAATAGFAAGAGIAANKLVAELAAAEPGTAAVVAAGAEAEFLAPLPLARLAGVMTPATARRLQRWGIETIGALARLPAPALASRLGDAGRLLARLARGDDPRPLVPRRPPPSYREGIELDWPVEALEPFQHAAQAVLERLLGRLERSGLCCRALELALKVQGDQGGTAYETRWIRLPAPTREIKSLLALLRLELERRPPPAPVIGFALAAEPDRARALQLTLFGPPAVSPDRLAVTLGRLTALLGPDRVGAPQTVEGHRPERYGVTEFRPPPPPELPGTEATRALLTVRVLRPPAALEVIVEAGRPTAVRSLPTDARRRPEIQGAVTVASGPWRLEEGWWTGAGVTRAYWDVELTGGGLYRIYQDHAADWFADGMYD